MRRVALVVLTLPCIAALAEDRPAKRDNLPDLAAPATARPADADVEPQVTIVQKKDAKVEEYRVKGRLYKMKVTPDKGKPYWLLDDRGDGEFIRYDNLDTGLRVPQWVIKRW